MMLLNRLGDARLVSVLAAISAVFVVQSTPAWADEVSTGQWYVNELRLPVASKYSTGVGVVVAVVDSGVDASHPALLGSILPGADFTDSALVSQGDGRFDDDGHGTAMAGLIVGHGVIRGVAPAAKILPVRVGEAGRRSNVATAIAWAADHGAKVINISLAAPLADPREKAAIEHALDRDVVVVAGVGNRPASDTIQFPARYPGVVAIAATNRSRGHASISVTGAEVLLSAPGEGISSTRLNHGYGVASGTSDSTALVAGVAALIRSRFPQMRAAEVVQRLIATAIDLGPGGRDDQFGFGLVNPVSALVSSLSIGSSVEVSVGTAVGSGSSTSWSGGKGRIVFGRLLLLSLIAVAGLLIVIVLIRRRMA